MPLLDGVLKREAVRVAFRALGLRVLYVVVQLDQTIFEALDGEQLQGYVAGTPRYQWDALPNENWGHTDDKLVDRLLVKKGGDDLAAAHQPDILARLLSETAHKWADGIVHELNSRWDFRWRRVA